MRVRLKSFFHFDMAKVFGHDHIELSNDSATIRDLLEEIERRSEGEIVAIDKSSGLIDVDYFVLLNGRDSGSLPERLETVLRHRDEVGIGMNYHWGGG